MIYEIAHIEVKDGFEATFQQGVAAAAPLFRRAKGCHGLSLQRGIERPTQYRLVVQWETVEDHTVGFRGSEDFQEWRRLVAHCFAQAPQVEHVETVLAPS
ncbi:MAG: antibiotic biosynthesis monooxygenase [Piscinibacter sp.]